MGVISADVPTASQAIEGQDTMRREMVEEEAIREKMLEGVDSTTRELYTKAE